jgi:hypothetical protein
MAAQTPKTATTPATLPGRGHAEDDGADCGAGQQQPPSEPCWLRASIRGDDVDQRIEDEQDPCSDGHGGGQ